MKTVLLLLLLCPVTLWAQLIKIAPQDTQRNQSTILMRDGSMVQGHIVRQDSSIITVRKRGGDMSFVEADQVLTISSGRPARAVRSGKAPAIIFVLKDSSQVSGTFVRRDSTMITVRKSNGQLTYFEPELLVRVDTVRLESTDFYAASGPSYPNRFSPWLLTGLTAYNAEKGRFYYRNTFLLLNEFDYGITQNWSIGANFITPSSFLSSVDNTLFNRYFENNSRLFSKVSVPIGTQSRLGLNVLYKDGAVSNAYKRGSLTFQALGSFGNSQRNVTLGYGLVSRGTHRIYQPIYSSSAPTYIDISTPNQSFLTLGIMQKVSPYLTLISDNRVNLGQYRYSYDDNSERISLSFALRLDRPRHAFDVGLTSLVYRDRTNYDSYGKQVRFLPYLSYNLIIGRP